MADIYGTEFDDVLVGTSESDYIEGQEGNDLLDGGDGNDLLVGGAGDNIYIGGLGNDIFELNYDVQTRTDLDPADDGQNILVFSPGDGEDVVEGFDPAKDKINLRGFGFETFADVENSIFEGNGRFYLAIEGSEPGQAYSLIVELVPTDSQPLTADNFLFGDVVVDPEPEPEDQVIVGTEADDVLVADDGNDTITGLGGNDIIDGKGGSDNISAGAGNDIIDGGFGVDTIDGGEGVDTIDFSSRINDGVTVDLSTGENTDGDVLTNIENITGTQAGDRLTGTDDANVLDGQDGSDTLFGNAGDDTLLGGAGVDNLFGGSGADILDGGAGNLDTANYYHSPEGVTVDLTTGTGQGGDAEGDTLIDIERITGSQFSDVLVGGADDDALSGWNGDDQLFGGDGDDHLSARGGNNLFVGGDGDDRLVGGTSLDISQNTFVFSAGDDADLIQFFDVTTDIIDLSSYQDLTYEQLLAAISAQGSDVVIDLGNGISGGVAGDQITLVGIDVSQLTETNFLFADPPGLTITGTDGRDQLNGSDYDDFIDGLRGSDTIFGGAGDDEILGGRGRDLLYGGEGDDVIYGDRGKDTIFGDAGNDEIHFGRGTDVATGGEGNDLFVYSKNDRADTITDFSDGDAIRFNGFDGINNYDDVMANASQSGDDVVITFGRDQLTLLDVDIATLDSDDFLF